MCYVLCVMCYVLCVVLAGKSSGMTKTIIHKFVTPVLSLLICKYPQNPGKPRRLQTLGRRKCFGMREISIYFYFSSQSR
ncbi:hypothetical protein BGW36DRAFT_388583 [Talaromyces proteolyticus]|uniref:Secreted protein n=1 Tax=Talaromyces proteolyticus TaxID=1131652 RepID=A0AAD4KI08_9EURO|nr:uncharacterized protein BGW36DRAFT_388583 [Talaromyces proteolyticus]KAH8691564.1 hypothetical protein BGW36DRAFT_388583 [Talaromyces proteolyticus]